MFGFFSTIRKQDWENNKDGFILQAYINSYISGNAVQNNGIDSEDFNVCQVRLLEIQDYLKKAALETEEKLK